MTARYCIEDTEDRSFIKVRFKDGASAKEDSRTVTLNETMVLFSLDRISSILLIQSGTDDVHKIKLVAHEAI